MRKLGTVTDLASVSLRAISAGLKLNTSSCSTALQTYLQTEILSSQDQLTTSNSVVDTYLIKQKRLIYNNTRVYADRCTRAAIPLSILTFSDSFRVSVLNFNPQCYQVTRCVPPQSWLKPFTLSNAHNITKTGGLF